MSKRTVIIGAGVIGLATAYYCARRGHAVTVVERKGAQRDGCSFGNAGMVVPSHFIPLAAPGMAALALKWMWNPASPFHIRPRFDAEFFGWAIKFWRAANAEHVRRSAPLLRDLSLASRACFEELTGLPEADFGFVKKGLLMLCNTEHGLEEEARTAGLARDLRVPAEVLTPGQAASLDPGARMDIAGAVYFPLDCHLTPQKFLAALQRQVESCGTQFLWETEVIGAEIKNNRLRALTTAAGTAIEGDEFVLCGGSWSSPLARQLGLRIPLQAGKGYSLTLPRPRQLPQLCSICTEARVAVTPMGDTLRIGGTMELGGLNEDINHLRVRAIINSFCRYFPEFRPQDFDSIQPWCGLRPCSPDGLPYVGRTEKFSNLSIAAGHGMMGLSLGPVTGKLMAEILSGATPQWDIAPLSPDRYG